jgi:hypothetical protein
MIGSASRKPPFSLSHAWSAVTDLVRWVMAPTVLAEWTVEPRWHLAVKHLRMLLVLAVYSLAWYAFGIHTATPSPTSAGMLPATWANPAAAGLQRVDFHAPPEPPNALAQATGAVSAEVLPPEDPDGLRIDQFRIGAVAGYPNRLRYELAISNKGRKLVGKLQFVVLGEQDGEVREFPADTATPKGDSKPRLEVARLLNTRGYLDLPEGYVVHKVVVQVLEGSQARVAQSAPMWPT